RNYRVSGTPIAASAPAPPQRARGNSRRDCSAAGMPGAIRSGAAQRTDSARGFSWRAGAALALRHRSGNGARRRGEPQRTVLHSVIRHHLESFLAEARERSDDGGGLPRFVEDEFRRYLACGVQANGFGRVRCGGCGYHFLVAFSCKRRGVCPSCNARRMHELWLSKESSPPASRVEPSPLFQGKPRSEREIIEAPLAESRGRVSGPSGAAAKLRIPPSTLESKIKTLKISKSQFKFR